MIDARRAAWDRFWQRMFTRVLIDLDLAQARADFVAVLEARARSLG